MNNKYKTTQNFVIQRTGKTINIFHGERSLLFSLNETATFIFTQLKQGKDVDTIIKQYTKRYDITENEALKDIKNIIEILVNKGVITPL